MVIAADKLVPSYGKPVQQDRGEQFVVFGYKFSGRCPVVFVEFRIDFVVETREARSKIAVTPTRLC